MSGTEVIMLCQCYAMSGTDVGYALIYYQGVHTPDGCFGTSSPAPPCSFQVGSCRKCHRGCVGT
eukprot:3470763-Rhodomonas_salina.3